MAEKIKVKNVINDDKSYLRITDLDNMFSVHLDQRGNYVFNLNETIYFPVDSVNLPLFDISYRQFWSTISYSIYGTTRLAWLLMKINNVDAENVFMPVEPGYKIRYIDPTQLQDIINNINS